MKEISEAVKENDKLSRFHKWIGWSAEHARELRKNSNRYTRRATRMALRWVFHFEDGMGPKAGDDEEYTCGGTQVFEWASRLYCDEP